MASRNIGITGAANIFGGVTGNNSVPGPMPAVPVGPGPFGVNPFMPVDAPVMLNTADARASAGVVFPGVLIPGMSSPADTRYGWLDTSGTPDVPKYYDLTLAAWVAFGMGATGATGADGAGTYSLLQIDAEAGTVGGTGIPFYPIDAAAFPVGAFIELTDSTLAVSFYQVTTQITVPLGTPSGAPTLTGVAGSTTLLAGTYKAGYTWVTATGETEISPLGTVTITAGQQIQVSALSPPVGATSVRYYLSVAAGSSTVAYDATGTGALIDLTDLPLGGAASSPPIDESAGILCTRMAWDVSASPTYSFTTANNALVVITGIAGIQGVPGTGGGTLNRGSTLSSPLTAGAFSAVVTLPVTAPATFVIGDYIKVFDGTASSYYSVTATGVSTVTATRLNLDGDSAQASAAYSFASSTPVYWTGTPGLDGTAGAAGAAGATGSTGATGATGPSGISPITTLTVAATLTGSSQVFTVALNGAFVIGSNILISDGTHVASFLLTAKGTGTMTMTPLGYPGDEGATFVFVIGSVVGVVGARGAAGSGGGANITVETPTISGATTTLSHTPIAILIIAIMLGTGGVITNDYTIAGAVITWGSSVQVGLTPVAQIVYTY